jgi:hypothetical protein
MHVTRAKRGSPAPWPGDLLVAGTDGALAESLQAIDSQAEELTTDLDALTADHERRLSDLSPLSGSSALGNSRRARRGRQGSATSCALAQHASARRKKAEARLGGDVTTAAGD